MIDITPYLKQLGTYELFVLNRFPLPEKLRGVLTKKAYGFYRRKTFFSQVIEYREAFQETKLKEVRSFARKVGIDLKVAEEVERFFFAMHTYFALLVKLIAWLAISRYIGVKLGAPDFGRLTFSPSE